MHKFFVIILMVFFPFISFGQQTLSEKILYIHPSPNAVYITPQSSIIIKVKSEYSEECVDYHFKVSGSESGYHNGRIVISDNTLIFLPDAAFNYSEEIAVNVFENSSAPDSFLKYSFTTGMHSGFDMAAKELLPERYRKFPSDAEIINYPEPKGEVKRVNGVPVPYDFPVFEAAVINEGIAPGKLFLNTWGGTPYILILENDGTPYFYQRVEEMPHDFKIQPTGLLTRHVADPLFAFVGMDSSCTITDTFRCANSYGTDLHELFMLENGNFFLIAWGSRYVDMSGIVPGGNTNAFVIDNHVQEFDSNNNLILEVLGQETFEITNAVHEDLTNGTVDYIHMNSIAVDYDDHIVTSSRNQSEVTKINRQTGEVMWRLGGASGDFLFINDEHGISYQHFARPVKNKPGHYLIHDNGNYHEPQFSRPVEYKLDTLNMVAEMVWDYRHQPELFHAWMGNSQRLPNGNTLINFASGGLPKAVEVDSNSNLLYEGGFWENTTTYRTYRFEWDYVSETPYLTVDLFPDKVSLIFNKFGDETVTEYIVYAGEHPQFMVPVDTTSERFLNLSELKNKTYYYFGVKAVYGNGLISDYSNIEWMYINFTEPGMNILENGNFSSGLDSWDFYLNSPGDADLLLENGECKIEIANSGVNTWDIQLMQLDVPLVQGREYRLEFDARAEQQRSFDAHMGRNSPPWDNYSRNGLDVLKPFMKRFSYDFVMENATDYQARLIINCGQDDNDIWFDNFSLTEISQTDIDERDGSKKPAFKLAHNYPNPFNPVTKIEFALPTDSDVKVELYNMLGEKITTIASGEFSAGYQSVKFNGAGFASGMYIYRITAVGKNGSEFIDSKKMILLK